MRYGYLLVPTLAMIAIAALGTVVTGVVFWTLAALLLVGTMIGVELLTTTGDRTVRWWLRTLATTVGWTVALIALVQLAIAAGP
jgi:hypothetical protein